MVTSGKKIEGYTYQFQTGDHVVISDVTEKLGGQNKGPSPHDYIEVALAACTSITLQMFASRRKMALDSVDVKVKIASEGAANVIEREIHFIGNLSAEDCATLMTIADKCPVHKLLVAGATINTKEI